MITGNASGNVVNIRHFALPDPTSGFNGKSFHFRVMMLFKLGRKIG